MTILKNTEFYCWLEESKSSELLNVSIIVFLDFVIFHNCIYDSM